MRLINAVREFNREHHTSMKTIALYTDPDRSAMFVREADEALHLGSVTFTDAEGAVKNRYLDYATLENALKQTNAEAAWVGWGFVAEQAEFVELCDRLGVVFIGPPADVIRKLGDKITAKKLAEVAEVPVAAWSDGPVEDLEQARAHGARLGYPLILKATAGGGGRGIRRIKSESGLAEAFDSARAEALKSFGNATVFMENMVEGARHIEVQIIADNHGNAWGVGVRDCTVQRNNQKVIEEAPSIALDVHQTQDLLSAAVRLVTSVGYVNAGTVEFLYKAETKTFAFMEVNTRLQVEHPVTELTTGADLVKLQLMVARGGKLPGLAPKTVGHAIEVRLCAEDPDNGFMPAPGRIRHFNVPIGPGVRVDTGVEAGDEVSPHFDSMVAKIIAYGRSRSEAMARMGRALEGSAVVIEGGTSNKGFLLELLDHPDVVKSDIHIGWLDQMVSSGERAPRKWAEIALLEAAIQTYEQELDAERSVFLASSRRGRPQVEDKIGRPVELGYEGEGYELGVFKHGPGRYLVTVEGESVEVAVDDLGQAHKRVSVNGKRYRVLSINQGLTQLVEVNGVPHRVSGDCSNVVRSPGPAVIVSVAVKEGDEVVAGERLVVLEAMKTETTLVAPSAGTVRQVKIIPNVQVPAGAPLLMIEPPSEETASTAERIAFSHLVPSEAPSAKVRWARHITALRAAVLGFDLDGAAMKDLAAQRKALRDELRWSETLGQAEDGLLALFADVCAVGRQQSVEESETIEARSAEHYLFTYLHDLNTRGERLPADFKANLERALKHHGIDDLEPSAALEEALFRLYVAQRRDQKHYAVIADILADRLEGVEGLVPDINERYDSMLTHLIVETQDRYEVINDYAREVHYRVFGQPLHESQREAAYAAARLHLDELQKDPEAADRAEHIAALASSRVPLRSFLSRRFDRVRWGMRQAILQAIVTDYYGAKTLDNVRQLDSNGNAVVAAQYINKSGPTHLFAAHAARVRMGDVVRALGEAAKEAPAGERVVLDLYVWHTNISGALTDTRDELLEMLKGVDFLRSVQRVVISFSSLAHELGLGDLEHFTFRRGEYGFEHDESTLGVHPMVSQRLKLWHLERFETKRLPTAEDVYLFEAVAKENPKDERLISVAEINDMTPVLDDQGVVVGMPELERVLTHTLAGMRWYQSRHAWRGRRHWNRVILHCRPPTRIQPDEVAALASRIAPHTEGLGLEKLEVTVQLLPRKHGPVRERIIDIRNPEMGTVAVRARPKRRHPIQPLSDYAQRISRLPHRLLYPYELITLLAPREDRVEGGLPRGQFVEHDLDDSGKLVPIEREPGKNTANIVCGVIKNFTPKCPEGMTRVLLMGDPCMGMGSLAEAECARVVAAIELAESMKVPLDWFAVSAGARISMESGTENLDWVALALRKIIEFTQAGGAINVVVNGINVGAQPYWNAEATMLMHTRGILIMTPRGAMVLTGKRALDYSGAVSADDNMGIGGYERIMGNNGQAQYFARDIGDACRILLRHYEHAYVMPGERFPRKGETNDPVQRDIGERAHGTIGTSSFESVGQVFSMEHNGERKKPFDIRAVMYATIDSDQPPLERWAAMQEAENAVVWDAHLGGYPVSLLGIESRPVPRLGLIPADGPDTWSGGTLFPLSSKKIARAINAASGNRPCVILANLSGFDGSPESMRRLQLEYGAEIGRSVVNFDGPIVFCVISRYHGGAFVVFSAKLNDDMEVAALEGSRASVIGGAPAAAVVFTRDVKKRTLADPRVVELRAELDQPDRGKDMSLWAKFNDVYETVRSEKLGEVADEFDGVHSVQRAQKVGSVHQIVAPANLRPYLVDAVERGMKKTLAR